MNKALEFARTRHDGQVWGGNPYILHLSLVATQLTLWGFTDPVMQAAAYLHDVVEDTPTTIDEVRQEFGHDVADLVWAVTNEPGNNRRERARATYPKIHALRRATILKLADRTVNVEQCWKSRDSRLFMYKREYPAFRVALREPADTALLPIWDHLDDLMGC